MDEPTGMVGRDGDDDTGTVPALLRLCGSAVETIPVTGAAVTLIGADEIPRLVAASELAGQVLEDLLLLGNEGPGLTAFATRRPMLVPAIDGAVEHRWPGLAMAAGANGVRAVFAFPLQIGAVRLGVLDTYREQPGVLEESELRRALSLADRAVEILLDGQAGARPGVSADGLDDVPGYRPELYHAQGMVMVQLGVGLGEALGEAAGARVLDRSPAHRRGRRRRRRPAPAHARRVRSLGRDLRWTQ